jgi:hypothetical protein
MSLPIIYVVPNFVQENFRERAATINSDTAIEEAEDDKVLVVLNAESVLPFCYDGGRAYVLVVSR